MEKFITQVKQLVPTEAWIYIVAVLAILLILIILLMVLRKRKAIKLLNETEDFYKRLKAVPLAFNLNKAEALSRVNHSMQGMVEQAQSDFNEISDEMKKCSLVLAKADDMIYSHKVKKGVKALSELRIRLNSLETRVTDVNTGLNELLEQESIQRDGINKLKESFRTLRSKVSTNSNNYGASTEYIQQELVEIESLFSIFEDLMFMADFTKASDQKDIISERMNRLDELCNKLPALYEHAKGILPRNMEEVGYEYAQAKNKGVYLDHLKVHSNLDAVSELLKEVLKRLRQGNLESVQEDLTTCDTRIKQLSEQIVTEDHAFCEIRDNKDIVFNMVETLNKDMEEIHSLYSRVCTRFGFENWNVRLEETDNKLVSLNDMKRSMEKTVQEEQQAASVLLVSYKELEQSTTLFRNDVDDMKQRLYDACSDEERAKKQLVKLQLVLNETKVKMMRHRLPNVSTQFEDDLRRAVTKVHDIEAMIERTPLDIKTLNYELRQTIDYVYTLYNSVNKLVGMAAMVENAIVFGNRYRATHPDIDSELTRADLCFRNGEYTKALKIAIQCIEKICPGSYEKLLGKTLLKEE